MLSFPARACRAIWRRVSRLTYCVIARLPYFHFIRNTQGSQTPCTFTIWFWQKVLGFNRDVYWPVHFTSRINQYQNIVAGIDTSPGYEPGCYIQGLGRIYLGDYTQIAQNVGIISANHDSYDSRRHNKSDCVVIGKYCWLGMNSVILPGVTLGDFTIVGAGAVVTKSFPDGHCIIAGNPARLIRRLDPEKCVPFRNAHEYNGYIPADRFDAFRRKKLWL